MGYYGTCLLISLLLVGSARAGCPKGTYEKNGKCLVCPVGYYGDGSTCKQCPLDTYSDKEQSTECTACPTGKKTLETGTGSASGCKDVCTIPTTQDSGYRVTSQNKLYTVSKGDRVEYEAELLFVCSPGYQYANTNTNKLEIKCGKDVELPTFCIRIETKSEGIEASQEGEAYLLSTVESITVSCHVYPAEQTVYNQVYFFQGSTVANNGQHVALAVNGNKKTATYVVKEEGTWRCALADTITDKSNKPVTDAVISKLTLTMDKPKTVAVATSSYSVSCEASYLDTMSLPDLTLSLNGKAVSSVTSTIKDKSFRITKTYSTPTSEVAGEYLCSSSWSITDGAKIGPSSVKNTVDFLGFKTKYPAKNDGTSAKVVMVTANSDVILVCDTFPMSDSGAKPTVKFLVNGAEASSGSNSHTLTKVTDKTTISCTATVGQQTVSTEATELRVTTLTVQLTPALVYGKAGEVVALTCTMTGENVQLAILNTYLDGSNSFTTHSSAVKNGASKFNHTITRTNTWARCGMYLAEQQLYFYSQPVRIYYRESNVTPKNLVLLKGQAGSFTLKVFGDPSVVKVSRAEITAEKKADKSSDWLSHYEVPITNAQTQWYGPLDFTVTYNSDKDTDVQETNLYVTDVTLKAYSKNIADGQDIILTCSHVNPPIYKSPTVSWFHNLDNTNVKIKEGEKVNITSNNDETVLTLKSVNETQNGDYSCSVQFTDGSGVVKFEKSSNPVTQNVVGEAYFLPISSSPLGERIDGKLRITCTADQQRPADATKPTIGVECQESDQTEWFDKGQRTTTNTDKRFAESFDVPMKATMNNRDCRCYGTFYDGTGQPYKISSPLTRVFAYDVQRFQGFNVDHYSMLGHSVTMKCSANGDGKAPIQWSKDSQQLGNSKEHKVTNTEPIDGKYTSTLTVSGITAEMDGAYICYVAYVTDVKLQANFDLHVLHVKEFNTATLYENKGLNAQVTCKVSQVSDRIPTVTWSVDGAAGVPGCADPKNVKDEILTCVHAVPITETLKRTVTCSLKYQNQPTLKGQSETTGPVTIVSQRVWSDQSKVTVVADQSATYVCYASGDISKMSASLNYPGNPTATKADISQYESKFTFQMASITAEKSETYQCKLNFDSPVMINVEVRIMVLTKKFPDGPSFQTVGQVQDFTCATVLMGENTNAKIRFDGGPMADKNQFEYFDKEGEASRTLTLKPVSTSMSLKTYTCSVEIQGSDADGNLTSSGLFVVQYVQLKKKQYIGVDNQSLSIPCNATGKEEDVKKISWEPSEGTPTVGSYTASTFSLTSVLTLSLSPAKERSYTCAVGYDPHPHKETLNLTVLKIETHPEKWFYLKAGQVATISCVGSHSVIPTFKWDYVSAINTQKQQECGVQYNPKSAGVLPSPDNVRGKSTIEHKVVESDHLRLVNCNMTWTRTDADGSLTTTPALIVVTYIDAQDEVYVIEKDAGKITCTVYGPSSVGIDWYKGDTKLSASNKYNIGMGPWDANCHRKTSTLTVNAATADSEGDYKCKTTGVDLEKSIKLKVYRVVDFQTDGENLKITQFDSASLACIASYPGGKFNFIKRVQGQDPEPQFSDYEVTTDKGVAAGWNINKFDEVNKGEYECKVVWGDKPAPVQKLELDISLVCQRPNITHGKLITDDPDAVWIKENQEGTVTCEPGYTLSGESSVKCLKGALMTPEGKDLNATCKAVPDKRCVVLPVPSNGRFNCSTDGSDLVCSVSCNEGYLISNADKNKYRCVANSGKNWDHVTQTNPLGKTATCDKKTARKYTYKIDADCSSINCDADCRKDFKKFVCKDKTITLESLLNSEDVSKKLKSISGGNSNSNSRKRRNALTFGCAQGSTSRGDHCVECSAGYYAGDSCLPCPAGQYSNETGQISCKKCGDGLSTLGEAASKSSECIKVCKIPAVSNGESYPPTGYSVPEAATITLSCNSDYDLEYNQRDEVKCANQLPKCYRRCTVVAPAYVSNGLKEVVVGNSLISPDSGPSSLCGGSADVKCQTGVPTIAHGFPITAVCSDDKSMSNGKTNETLYCKQNVAFSFPECPLCKKSCNDGEWQCKSNCKCIPNKERCDGVQDCLDIPSKKEISDEWDCPEDNDSPTGIQFDHWQDQQNPNKPVTYNYSQKNDWLQFSACFWLQTSYKGPQTVFSYGGKISVSVHDQDLAVHFNFESTESTFSNRASGITDGNYHRVCISWNSVGGVVDLYYDDVDIIDDEQFKTWSVSSKDLNGGDVKLSVGGSSDEKNINSFHGFIKDMLVMEKQLDSEDIDNFKFCKFPASDSTRIRWSNVLTEARSQKQSIRKHLIKYNKVCTNPSCEGQGSCPVDMFMCGSCDCVQPWQRCDLFTQHCIDHSDELSDCKKTNGVFKPYNTQSKYSVSRKTCVAEGGHLASLDSEFENSLSAKSLEIDDIRTAWIGMSVTKGKALSTWANGAPKSEWAMNHYTDTTRVSKDVGLKNNKEWLPIFGLFSDELPFLCRTQGYLIAKLNEIDLSVEDWKKKCTKANDLTSFTLADIHYRDRATSVLRSRGLHKIDGWKGVAWAKSDLKCDYVKSDGSISNTCDTYWNIPSFCAVDVELEQVAQAYLTGAEDSYFLWDNPWSSRVASGGTSELSVCFTLKSAAESGTVLRYSAGNYENEILVYISSKSKHQPLDILEFTAHNRVNFFPVQLLDGLWHSVCVAWRTATGPTDQSGIANLYVDGKSISQYKTQAVWPKNLYNAKLSASGRLYIGRQGDSSFTDTKTLEKQSRTFRGALMNLNVWKKLLSGEEMQQMTQDDAKSFKCGPIVVQEASLILRWRDLLHYSSSGVKISTVRDHTHCGVLYYETDFYASTGGRKIKLRSAEKNAKQAVRFGDTVRIIKHEHNHTMVKCSSGDFCPFTTCSVDDPCGTEFIVSTSKWEIGRAVAITDQIFLKVKDSAKILKGLDKAETVEKLRLESEVQTYDVTVDYIGWKVSSRSACNADCQEVITRTCEGGTEGDSTCPGTKEIKKYCDCGAHGGCPAPAAESSYSGTYQWRHYKASPAQWFTICPYGDFETRFLPETVIAKCEDNVATYDNITCSFQSEAAQELYKLLYGGPKIDDDNVEDVSSKASNAIQKADDLGTVHVNLAANITTQVSNVKVISEKVADNVLNVFDTLTVTVAEEDIVESSKESNGPKKLVDSIETAAKKMNPQPGEPITLKKKSVGMKVMDVPDTQTGSVSFSISKTASQPIDEVDFSEETLGTDGKQKKTQLVGRQETVTKAEEKKQTVSIEIAADVAKQSKQLSFMVYNSSKMFVASKNLANLSAVAAVSNPFETGTLSIQSSVLGGSVDDETANSTNVGNTRNAPAATLTMSAQGGVNKDRTPYCVYWDDEHEMWSQTGLHITSCNPDGVSCTSNHLTNFAVLMNIGDNTFSPAHKTAMSVLTVTGGALSILCLTLTVVGLAIGKMRRNPTYHIHLCLALTLGLAMLVFLVGLDRRENFILCKVFAVLIHYLFLASICWMLVEGVNLYIALIIVFGVNHKKLKIAAHCFSWGFPALLCLITVLVDAFVTGFELYEVCMTAKYCFLNHRGRMYFFVAPIMLMMAINIFIFVRVIIVLAKATKNRDGWTDLRQVTVIASITGISWVFGAMTVGGSVGTLVFNYIYIILNSFQGIVIFYFHCFGKPDVRNAWTEKLSTGTSRFISSSNSQGGPASYGTAGRKISAATGVSDPRYSTTAAPRISTATMPGQPGGRLSVAAPPGPRVGPNNRPNRFSVAGYNAPLSPMPFQASPNPRRIDEEGDDAAKDPDKVIMRDTSNMTPVEDVIYEDLDIKLQNLGANDEEAAYDTIELQKETDPTPNKEGTATRRRRRKQEKDNNTAECLVEENQYVTLGEGTKTADENNVEERIKEGSEEKKILNTVKQEDLAIEDVELAPSEPEPVVSNSAVATATADPAVATTTLDPDVAMATAGADVVFFPDTGKDPNV